MTKLIEWLLGIALIFGIWSAFIAKSVTHPVLDDNWLIVVYFPVLVVGLFGLYAVSVILWRVYTFNDCEDAAKELLEEIDEAKDDLKKKGFIFADEER